MNIGFHPCYNLQTLVYSFYRHYLLKYFLFKNNIFLFLKFIFNTNILKQFKNKKYLNFF